MNAMDSVQTHRPTTTGEWWRFDRYRIVDGWLVAAKGAELEWYNPWKDFRGGTHKAILSQASLAKQPIYSSLMRLESQITFTPGVRRYPDCVNKDSQQLIVEWCQQYGPLGVLLSQWDALYLAPQCDSAGDWSQIRYSRGFGQVVQESREDGDLEGVEPLAIVRHLNDLEPKFESPGKTWGRFFPSVRVVDRDAYQYPRPYSDSFCTLYAERLSHFCAAVRLLTGAMRQLGEHPPPKTPNPKLARSQALATLNILRRPVDSVLAFNKDRKPFLRWTSASLLASLAEMFVQDLAYGHSTLVCTACNLPFVSSAYQARYCSELCRLREQKWRLRWQMKQAVILRAQGQGVKQIAAALKQETEIVNRWLMKAPPKRGKQAR